jgi:hypothetical protein
MNKFLDPILAGIKNAELEKGDYRILFDDYEIAERNNELLFFTKPELIRSIPEDNVAEIFSLILARLAAFGIGIKSIILLTGVYLDENDIVSRHYGIIDEATRQPSDFFSESIRDLFTGIFGRKYDPSLILGGFDYIERFGVDPRALAENWLSHESKKLASGMYCAYDDERDVYIINGFYPRMLRHFTSKESIVIGFVLETERPWKELRNDFLGVTDPAKASSGSLREELLRKKDRFGIKTVSANFNGVHLSAGPVEALVELIRFTCDKRTPVGLKAPADFSFGKKLMPLFSPHDLTAILSNGRVGYRNREYTVYDLTEEVDSNEAIARLSEAVFL